MCSFCHLIDLRVDTLVTAVLSGDIAESLRDIVRWCKDVSVIAPWHNKSSDVLCVGMYVRISIKSRSTPKNVPSSKDVVPCFQTFLTRCILYYIDSNTYPSCGSTW